eukprot:486397-Hanusia_phi.AAC.3
MNFTLREIEEMFLTLAKSMAASISYRRLLDAVKTYTQSRSRDFGPNKKFEKDSQKIQSELKCFFMTSLHAFVFFDIRGRDFISKKDLGLGLKRLKIKELINLDAAFEECDLDHDGKINYKEFIRHFSNGWHSVEDYESVQAEYEKLKRDSRRRWMTNDIPSDSSPPKKNPRPRSGPPGKQERKESAKRTLNFDASSVYAGAKLEENFSSDTESDEDALILSQRNVEHADSNNEQRHEQRESGSQGLPQGAEHGNTNSSSLNQTEQFSPRRLAQIRLLNSKKKKEMSLLQEQENLIRQRQEMLEQKRIRRLMLDQERLERAKLIKRKEEADSESSLRLFSRFD